MNDQKQARSCDDAAIRTQEEVAAMLGIRRKNLLKTEQRALMKLFLGVVSDPVVRRAAEDIGLQIGG